MRAWLLIAAWLRLCVISSQASSHELITIPFDGVWQSNSVSFRVENVISYGIIFVFAQDLRTSLEYLFAARFLLGPDGPISYRQIHELQNKCAPMQVGSISIIVPHMHESTFGVELARTLEMSFRPLEPFTITTYGPQPFGLPEGARLEWSFEMDFTSQQLSMEARVVDLNNLDHYNEPPPLQPNFLDRGRWGT